MKALRLNEYNKLDLREEPEPVVDQGECLLGITAVGICGSDLLWLNQGNIGDARIEKPLILGHEFAGIIESGKQKGRHVAVDPAIPCVQCRYCLEGNPNLCENIRFAGHGPDDGALRERMNWPESCMYPLPDNLTDIEGVMLEPLGVALHALDLTRVQPGMKVGVFGCGPIGLLLIQLIKASGATRIIATDPLEHRLKAAKALGATFAIPASDGRESEEVLSAAGGDGLDLSFEAAGQNTAVETAMRTTRPGRQVILIGIPPGDQTVFTASVARRKGFTIKLVRRMKHTYPRAISLVQNGIVDVKSLVTHRFPFSEYNEAFTAAKNREGIKVIIEL